MTIWVTAVHARSGFIMHLICLNCREENYGKNRQCMRCSCMDLSRVSPNPKPQALPLTDSTTNFIPYTDLYTWALPITNYIHVRPIGNPGPDIAVNGNNAVIDNLASGAVSCHQCLFSGREKKEPYIDSQPASRANHVRGVDPSRTENPTPLSLQMMLEFHLNYNGKPRVGFTKEILSQQLAHR